MSGTAQHASPATLACAAGQLLDTACRHIATNHALEGASLSGLTVLIPDLHASASVARALSAAYAVPVLVLPRIATLRSWATTISVGVEVAATAEREVLLYRALGERSWLQGADLWSVAADLNRLFDELTRWHVKLPAIAEEFKTRLEAAYRARAGASFGFEARLVHELWHACHSVGSIDAEAAYGIQLARLAETVDAPIYTLALPSLAPAEQEFLRRCSERVAVTLFAVERMACTSPVERFLVQAWPRPVQTDLHTRARELRAALRHPPMAGRLRMFGATSAEQHARAVEVSVRRWLLSGRRSIAVVVFDRVVARRARALLERAQVLVRDEAGWALSTTSAATVVGRWLDAASNDFHHADFLDLLKSPFTFGDWPRAERNNAVWRLEQALGAANVRSGLARYIRLAEESKDRALRQLLKRVEKAHERLARSRMKTLRGWLQALNHSLAELGVRDALSADAAGIVLLHALETLEGDLEKDSLRLGFSEWRRWLAGQLESATFRDQGIDSPVTFTTLSGTRLRRFEAVLLLGADAAHLPGPAAPQTFFNQRVRLELGLPSRTDELQETEDLLSALIADCDDVLATWESSRDGEANLLSPLLDRMATLHELAWNASLEDPALGAALETAALVTHQSTLPSASARPAPSVPQAMLPKSISASGYGSLLACPYQFHARYVLGLGEVDEVEEEVEKVHYGMLVHGVLSDFHRLHPRVSDITSDEARRRLVTLSQSTFEAHIAWDYQTSAWLARWLALVPRYIEWQRAREAQGWQFAAGEADKAISIETPHGYSFVLRGRIDRVDLNAAGLVALVDYKTGEADPLKEKLKTAGEDVQLPVYAALWGGAVAAALFLSIGREDVVPVELHNDVMALAHATRTRLGQVYDEIAAGAGLPAQGDELTCEYCEQRGLCRKGYWLER